MIKSYKKLFWQSQFFFTPIIDVNAFNKAKSIRQKKHMEIMMNLPQDQIKELNLEEKKKELLTQYIFPNCEQHYQIFESKIKQLDNEQVSNPLNAWQRIIFPFKSNSVIRDRVQRFNTDEIRVGKLLEVLDMTAGTVAYNYCYKKLSDTTIVTACIDNVHFCTQVNIFKDLTITAYPTFAGTSTIEIQFDLCQDQEMIGEAKFLMVARNSKNYTQKYRVPKFQIEKGDDYLKAKQRFQKGEQNQQTRIKQAAISLQKIPPNQEEVKIIHDFFLNREQYKQDPKNWLDILDTKLEKAMLMHKQERNIHGKIFGGYLIREAVELGWYNAKLFSNQEAPIFFNIDDCQFIQPVDVGSAVNFKSRVAYIHKNFLQVVVECEKIISEKVKQKMLELHLTFVIPSQSSLRNVYPKTYKDAMYYLDAKRKMISLENK